MAQTTTPTIVTVNTAVTVAPTISQLQQSGAIVSTGGTTLAPGTYQFLGAPANLTSILAAPVALTSLAWAANVVTATSTTALQAATGQTFTTIITGAVPAGYNGTVTATVTGSNTFTYPLTANPGTETVAGFYTPGNSGFVLDSVATFFAQGSAVGVYVLELGPESTGTAAVAALEAWIVANSAPQTFYGYLVPKDWDSAALNSVAQLYSSPSGQTYFFVTTTVATILLYAGNKAVFATVTSPTAARSEHQAAAAFYNWLVNKPGPANQLAPMAYRYQFGVTPWAQMGNATNIITVLSAFGNVILTGAEGGISNACLFKGTTMDGFQSSVWYGIDWFRIQIKQALAAAIINGSNSNPPLLYDQAGINTLLAVAQSLGNDAVAFGCAQSVVVTAVPFATYTAQNPNDYAAGVYNGFAATLVSQNGFLTITFNLDATQFAS